MTTRLATMRSLVEFLCSPVCMGRLPGTQGSAAARSRIIETLAAAGVEPAGEEGFEQRVPGCGANVLGRIAGAGALSDRAVLVAAHYDHLGPARGGEAFWGADDNAAAVAIMLDVATMLASRADAHGDSRQVIIAAFDGEEPPHFMTRTMGSMHWVRHPTIPVSQVDTMICMDLVGHAIGPSHYPDPVRQSLFVLGAEMSVGTAALVDEVAASAQGVVPRRLGLDVVPPLSDYYAFVEAGVPALFLTCGRWEHYHQVTDTPDKLDYEKMLATADYLRALTIACCRRSDRPVRFDPDARDDRASVETLIDIAMSLRTVQPEVGLVMPALEGLREAAARGAFGMAQRHALAMLVRRLESLFAAT